MGESPKAGKNIKMKHANVTANWVLWHATAEEGQALTNGKSRIVWDLGRERVDVLLATQSTRPSTESHDYPDPPFSDAIDDMCPAAVAIAVSPDAGVLPQDDLLEAGCSAFVDGLNAEYYSSTNRKWCPAVVHPALSKIASNCGFPQVSFSVTVGPDKQMRFDVPFDAIRPQGAEEADEVDHTWKQPAVDDRTLASQALP